MNGNVRLRRIAVAAAACLVAGASLAGGCSSSPCLSGNSVEMDVEAITVLPWDDPRPVENAEACLERPEACTCARTGPEGFATLQVPASAEVLVTLNRDGFIPSLTQRVTAGDDVPLTTRMPRNDEFDLLGQLAGTEIDPTRGHVGLGLLPPPDGDASGLTATMRALDGGEVFEPIYVVGLTPDPSATATDEEGVGFFLNVPPGSYEVETTALEQCASVESGWPRLDGNGRVRAVEVEVRAGTISAMSAVECRGAASQ